MKQFKILLWLTVAILFTACGGGGSSETTNTSGTNVPVNSFEKTLSLRGGEDFKIAMPNGISFNMPAINANGDITNITVRSTTKSYDFEKIEEEHVASLFEVEFVPFSPEAYGVNAIDFIPQIIIPKSILKEYDINTLSVFRVSDMLIDGEIVHDYSSNLPITILENGDMLVSDYSFPISITSENDNTTLSKSGKQTKSVAATTNKIHYVVGTFRSKANWSRKPVLKQFFPDASVPEGRVTYEKLSTAEQKVEDDKNITNIIVFVHGHNEMENLGYATEENIRAPWIYPYKRDVWTEFYKYLSSGLFKNDCTATYEFIYPTYRPIFTETKGVERLDKDFAKTINELIANSKKDINLYIVAHSMGGLVSRAGIQLFNSDTQNAFKKLVTWGSPHWGSSLVTLRYLFSELDYAYQYDGLLGGDVTYAAIVQNIDSLAIDSPGERDLRRASHPGTVSDLTLYESFHTTDRISSGAAYLRKKYNLFDGTWLYNENLKLLNDKDIYKTNAKYHAIYGLTTRAAWTPKGPNTGAKIIKYFQLTPIMDQESDGAASESSISGDKIMGASTYIGDIDHEEYFNDPAASAKMVAKTLDIFNMKECSDASYEVKEWDNWPDPQYCPIVASNDRFHDDLPAYFPGDATVINGDFTYFNGNSSGYGFFVDTNNNPNDHTRVQCVYKYSYGKEHWVLWLERPWLDINDSQYLKENTTGVFFQDGEGQDKVRHGWWKEYTLVYDYSYPNPYYTPRLMLTRSVEYYAGDNIAAKEGDNVYTFESFPDPGFTPLDW